jgi:vitamin B12 transporter
MKGMIMNRKKYISIVLAALLGPAVVQAGEDVSVNSVPTMREVVVTATRSESFREKVGGSSVTVISHEEIEAKKQNTVGEVLKSVPGIDVKSNGGLGTNTSVFIRGADNKNTLILVDGVMFNDPSSATRSANIANLTIDNIERIEIVRGPMSVLYGSNATAGVINIITRKGDGKTTFSAGVEGGSFDTWKIYGGSHGIVKKINYSLSASRTETEGFSTADDDNDRIPHAGNTSEKDGWNNTTVSGKFGIDITPDFDISAVIRYLDSETELDDYGPDYLGDRFGGWPAYPPEPNGLKEKRVKSEQVFAKVDIRNAFRERTVQSDLYLQAANQKRDAFDNDGQADYDYDGESIEGGWQGTLNISDSNTFLLGTSYFKEKMNSDSSSITNKDARTVSFWLQDQLFVGDSLDIVAGVRFDDHDRFGGKATYRVAPAYTIDRTQTTVKANYGTGFRAPSLFELFSSYGNENLQAEESRGWDFGLEQELAVAKMILGVTYFEMNFENRIAYDYVTWQYEQQPGDTKTSGVEAFVQWQPVGNVSTLLSYTYNNTEDPDGERLARRPRNKVYLNTRYEFMNSAMLNLDFYWVDERDTIPSAKDKDGNRVTILDSYTLVNLSAHYKIADHLTIYGRIDNLLDAQYEDAWSYASPGLSGYLGAKLTY